MFAAIPLKPERDYFPLGLLFSVLELTERDAEKRPAKSSSDIPGRTYPIYTAGPRGSSSASFHMVIRSIFDGVL